LVEASTVEELERIGAVFPPIGAPVLVAETTLFASNGHPGGWRQAVHRAEDFKYACGLSR
jgi:GntR family transcriptional regulator